MQFGYKNHINVDKRRKLIHQYMVTDAAVHDSQCLEALLDPENQGVQVFADSAYRSTEAEQMPSRKGYRSRIHEKAQRNRPLTKRSWPTRAGHTTAHGLNMPLAPWYSRVVSFCAPLAWLALKSKSA
ncbi:transposase [Acidithiobacillus ferrooxidans]|uniref:transposase n=1 Tax=Acidithiobacillus ferrooxidans TaxID=920 RepID=UPI0023B2C1FE|nr:transposase [Acidithiobacillus ferrooxidans]